MPDAPATPTPTPATPAAQRALVLVAFEGADTPLHALLEALLAPVVVRAPERVAA